MPIDGIKTAGRAAGSVPRSRPGFRKLLHASSQNPLGDLAQERISRPYGKCRVERANGSLAYRLANPRHMEDALMLYEVRTYPCAPGPWLNLKSALPSGSPCGRNTPNWGPS